MRYFLDITYDGKPFHGWQRQKNAISVQEEIEKVFSTILQTGIEITGSGRTDTGVHALQQVAHLDTSQELDHYTMLHKANAMLPHSISVNSLQKVKDGTHARFDATSREYQYFIHQKKQPFKHGRSYYFKADLNISQINEACHLLMESQDFESFSKVKTEVNNFLCNLDMAIWSKEEAGYVFTIRANRFLRGMVRAIVGTLIELGLGKLSLEEFAFILDKKDREAAGYAVPPEGLYLTTVKYPDDIYI